ncbi:MAG: hypothetical protein OXI34_10250 [Chloroflexota bacterium]|nr:hypothetical protein [Chloroflexota bacterium]MDE2948875.1 hypothetical protein [Chloroflexota bacterium]
MWRFAQVGIALGALGGMICFMGLFPGVTGAAPTAGIGLVQVMMALIGYTLLILGAITYLKFTFFLEVPANLVQQIGTRLALTGILFATLSGMADILGFGTHIRDETGDLYFGQLQMIGILASFVLSSLGVLIYVLAGANVARHAPVEALSEMIAGVDDTSEIQLPEIDAAP